jgi:hypothetical protein
VDRELSKIIGSIGRVEVAMALTAVTATRHFVGIGQRCCGNLVADARRRLQSPTGPDRQAIDGWEEAAVALYCGYSRDLAGLARVSTFSFLETLDRLREQSRPRGAERVPASRPGFPRARIPGGPMAKHHLQY